MQKFLILFSLLTIISLNGKVLGIIRDTTILNLEGSDAVIIPFIKIWFVLPVSFLLIRIYQLMLRYLSKAQVFLILTLSFCSFFATFLFLLEPNIDALRAVHLTAKLKETLPESAAVFLAAIRDWPYTLFFIASEMWTVFMFSFLFWSFASEVVTASESKKFYGYFSLDFAGIFAGLISLTAGYVFHESWHSYLRGCLLAVFALASVQVILYFAAYRLYYPDQHGGQSAKKVVAANGGNARSLYKNLFGIVFFFEFCDHFLDIIWKNQLRAVYPDTQSMGLFWSQFIFYTGIAGVLVTIFISSRSLQRFSWLANALVTPIFVLLSSMLLFSCFLEKEFALLGLASFVNLDRSILVIGTIQACFLKITKCTFFDNSKELAFLSVDAKARPHCRSICDTFSSRFAKSSSALSWQIYAMIPGALQTVLPLGLLVIGGACVWNKLVYGLSVAMNKPLAAADKSYDNSPLPTCESAMEPI